MKTRTGFVSNSSSSNFVVAFPRMPRSVADVQAMMFGTFDVIHDLRYYGDKYTAKQIAESVWRQIKGKKANVKAKINRQFDYLDNCYGNMARHFTNMAGLLEEESTDGLSWNNKEDGEKIHAILTRNYEKRKNFGNVMGKTWLEFYQDQFSYVLGYSDNDGEFPSFMEHGNIFRNLPHIQFSHH